MTAPRAPVSLRWRLMAAFVAFAVATTAVFLFGVREMVHTGWRGYGRPLVAGTVDLMAREIGTPPDPARAEAITRRMPVVIRIEGPVVNWTSPNLPAHAIHLAPHVRVDAETAPFMIERRLADGHRLLFGLAAEPTPPHQQRIAWLTLGLLLALAAAAFAYVRWLFRPLEAIREGVLRFGRGEFGHRIAVTRRDELGDLARRVDTLGRDVGAMLDAKRALLMALSHELRSPLTRARLNAELVEDGAPREALLRDLAVMRDLVEDLLESERLAAGHVALLREPVDLRELVDETVARHFAGRAVEVEVAPGLPPFEVDRLRVRLLLRNLVDNALRHGGGGRAPVLRVDRDEAGDLRLSVRDFGPGVPPEDLARLGEAFHRVDPARARATGGAGLGLTLCRLVVEAHGGRWRLEDAGPGLRVEVRLPHRIRGMDEVARQ